MKILIFVLSLLFAQVCLAAKPVDYDAALKNYKSWSDNIDKPEFYSQFSWKVDDKKIKFSEMSEFDKDQFYIVQTHKVLRELYLLEQYWTHELILSKLPRLDAETSSSQISTYLLQLQKLRIETAIKSETFVKTLLEKHKDKISSEESNYIIRRLERWRKAQNLIQ